MRFMFAWMLVMALPLGAQQAGNKKGAVSKIDQVKIDAAIQKGIEFLKSPPPAGEGRRGAEGSGMADDLILWTFVQSGVPESDPDFEKMFGRMMEGRLERTYNVSLQAMILEKLDRAKYEARITECAQFLIDAECRNGQWSYDFDSAPRGGRGDVRTKDEPATPKNEPSVATKPGAKSALKKTRSGPESGDNSNSQYAALGLRACHDAGVALPREVLELARKWWRGSQHTKPVDNGGGRGAAAVKELGTGGWSYYAGVEAAAYGSMTAGAVASLVIYDYILDSEGGKRKVWKADKEVAAGLAWLDKNFTVTENPGSVGEFKDFYYYYLYALERVGALNEIKAIGAHEWYPEGVKVLLEAQKPDGSWGRGKVDTCFAILFLRRATKPPVVSEDRTIKKS